MISRTKKKDKKKIKKKTKKTKKSKKTFSKKLQQNNKKTLKLRSFSPEVNRIIGSLKTISPHLEIPFIGCDDNKIYIKKNGILKCYKLNTKIAKKYMLDNLLSKKKINCNKIIGPAQNLSNCWFNCFLITFFIGDKPRKFFRHLRKTMITGELSNGEKINPKLVMPLLMLNKYIESTLIGGNSDEESMANSMDSNKIIKSIGDAFTKINKKKYIPKVNEPGNGLLFYLSLINYLNSKELLFTNINTGNESPPKKLEKVILNILINNKLFIEFNKPYDFFIISRESIFFPLNSYHIRDKITLTIQKKKHHYILSAVILQDITGSHDSCYFICNGKEFAYDGQTISRIIPFNWKKMLNINKEWTFDYMNNAYTFFNFQRGRYRLFYFKV